MQVCHTSTTVLEQLALHLWKEQSCFHSIARSFTFKTGIISSVNSLPGFLLRDFHMVVSQKSESRGEIWEQTFGERTEAAWVPEERLKLERSYSISGKMGLSQLMGLSVPEFEQVWAIWVWGQCFEERHYNILVMLWKWNKERNKAPAWPDPKGLIFPEPNNRPVHYLKSHGVPLERLRHCNIQFFLILLGVSKFPVCSDGQIMSEM